MNRNASDGTATILVVDDTPTNIAVLVELLGGEGYRVLVAKSGTDALDQLDFASPDLIMLDVMMPGLDGYEVCRRLKSDAKLRDIPVVFMTALAEPEEKLKGFRVGGEDYVTKPLQHEEVLARIRVHIELHQARRALVAMNASLEQRVADRTAALDQSNARLQQALEEIEALKNALQAENVYLREEIRDTAGQREIIGRSPGLNAVMELVAKVAPTTSTVLVAGETGTGKELVARAIHEHSRRAERPLVKLNCAAISAGLVESELFGHVKGAFTGALDKRVGRFELADGGTIFLDEVSELPLDTQVKLLRVLQEGEFEPVGSSRTLKVDVRVIAATNRQLTDEVEAGRFRADLFHRLNVFPIRIPPLRERSQDIALLAHHFLERATRKLGKTIRSIDPQSIAMLASYRWPGNVRDLQNVIERAAILTNGEVLVVDPSTFGREGAAGGGNGGYAHAPAAAPTQSSACPSAIPGESLADVERGHIISVLHRAGGVIEGTRGAARILNMKPSTVRYRMKKLGIRREDYIR